MYLGPKHRSYLPMNICWHSTYSLPNNAWVSWTHWLSRWLINSIALAFCKLAIFKWFSQTAFERTFGDLFTVHSILMILLQIFFFLKKSWRIIFFWVYLRKVIKYQDNPSSRQFVCSTSPSIVQPGNLIANVVYGQAPLTLGT